MLGAYPIDQSKLTFAAGKVGAFKEKRNFKRQSDGTFNDEGPMLDEAGRQVYRIEVLVSDGITRDVVTVTAPVDGEPAFISLDATPTFDDLRVSATARDGRAVVNFAASAMRIIAKAPRAAAGKPEQQRLL